MAQLSLRRVGDGAGGLSAFRGDRASSRATALGVDAFAFRCAPAWRVLRLVSGARAAVAFGAFSRRSHDCARCARGTLVALPPPLELVRAPEVPARDGAVG